VRAWRYVSLLFSSQAARVSRNEDLRLGGNVLRGNKIEKNLCGTLNFVLFFLAIQASEMSIGRAFSVAVPGPVPSRPSKAAPSAPSSQRCTLTFPRCLRCSFIFPREGQGKRLDRDRKFNLKVKEYENVEESFARILFKQSKLPSVQGDHHDHLTIHHLPSFPPIFPSFFRTKMKKMKV